MEVIIGILRESWDILMESSIYILFGFFVAGLLYIFVSPEKIAKYLGRGKIRSVIYASFWGIPIPLCSCGVLPTAVSLKKQGANNGASIAFLISTPESGVDSIAITYALFDPIMTIARPISAFITGTTAGILENISGSKSESYVNLTQETCKVDGCCSGDNCSEDEHKRHHSFLEKLWAGLKYAFIDLIGDIAKWLIIGIVIAGLISYLIPPDFVVKYLGGGIQSMIIMLIIGIPLYICATASTPIAAALVLKGMSPGAALVFLLAGPATNTTSIPVITKFLGKKATGIYLATIAVMSLILGLTLDYVYLALGIKAFALSGQVKEIFPASVRIIASLSLILLMINGLWHEYKEKGEG